MFHTFAAANVKRFTLVKRRRRWCQRFYIAVTSLTHPIYVILPPSCEPGKELGEVGSSENSDENSASAIRSHVVAGRGDERQLHRRGGRCRSLPVVGSKSYVDPTTNDGAGGVSRLCMRDPDVSQNLPASSASIAA